MYSLYYQRLHKTIRAYNYIWCKDGVVFEQRLILPFGFLNWLPLESLIDTKPLKKGWTKVRDTESQEKQGYLARGILLYN